MSLFLGRYENWEATIGFPPAYDWEPCKYEGERGHVESMASMAELDQRGHFLQYMVSLEGPYLYIIKIFNLWELYASFKQILSSAYFFIQGYFSSHSEPLCHAVANLEGFHRVCSNPLRDQNNPL